MRYDNAVPSVLMRTLAAASLLICGLSAAKLPEWYSASSPMPNSRPA